ncbi:MAG: hypothetical protein ACKN9T_14725, partial [Candidatus Methylumidiphilus sp.]
KRRFVRRSAHGKRRFVVGLARLINDLSQESPHPLDDAAPSGMAEVGLPLQEEDDIDEVEIVLDQSGGTGRDVIWAKDKGGPGGMAAGGVQRGAAEGAANVELIGSMLNLSAGGYCLQWLNASVDGARVGELIGLYEDERRIHLGLMRWLHHKAKLELVIGVQLLSPVVEAVDIETGAEADSLPRGLYLFANARLGQPASLLCGPGMLKPGHDIVLRSKVGERLPFHLEQLLSATLSFQLFSLSGPTATDA